MELTIQTFLIVCPFLFLAGLVDLKLAVPSVLAAILGSSIGANLSLSLDEAIMEKILFFVLPAAALVVLNKNLFFDKGFDHVELTIRTYLTAAISAFVAGLYDGFYGPGTGTFLIIAFTVFAKNEHWGFQCSSQSH